MGDAYVNKPGIFRPLYLTLYKNYSEEVITLSILVIIKDKKKSVQPTELPASNKEGLANHMVHLCCLAFHGLWEIKRVQSGWVLLVERGEEKKSSQK